MSTPEDPKPEATGTTPIPPDLESKLSQAEAESTGTSGSAPSEERGAIVRALDFVFKPIWGLIVSIVTSLWLAIRTVANYIWDIIQSIFQAFKALLFLIFNTFTTLLPSAAFTTVNDDTYNKALIKKLEDLIMELPLDKHTQKIIVSNWLEQLGWTNGRATRERNANELIRWWQIILGVLIPVIANSQSNPETGLITIIGIGLSKDVTVSTLGIFVAILTAVAQFRRPEERWRHYRLTTESYLNEIWAFISLSGKEYGPFTTHEDQAVKHFHDRMSQIRQEDTNKFFGEIFNENNNNRMSPDEIRQLLAEAQKPPTRIQGAPVMAMSATGQAQIIPPDEETGPSVG